MMFGSKKGFSVARRAPGSWLLIACGVVSILASVIMWWDLIRDGATLSDSLAPAAFTALGVFWLLLGFGAVGERR